MAVKDEYTFDFLELTDKHSEHEFEQAMLAKINRFLIEKSNHIFCAIYAYVKLEKLKLATTYNHFSLKSKIYMASTKMAMNAFYMLCESTQNHAFA